MWRECFRLLSNFQVHDTILLTRITKLYLRSLELILITENFYLLTGCYSVTLSCLTLWPHGLQHARLPCPSLSPGVWSNSCPLNQWCHTIFSPSVAPFSYFLQSFPQSGCFPVSQLFASGGQHIGASQPSPSNEYSGLISFRIDWINLLAVLGTFKSLLQHHSLKASILQHSAFLVVQLSHPHMATGKT